MRNKGNIFLITLLVLSAAFAFYFFYSALQEKKNLSEDVLDMKDNIALHKFQESYLLKLIETEEKQNDKTSNFSSVNYFKMDDGNRKLIGPVSDLVKSGKKKIFIRYTEIGCNACADSTFKSLYRHRLLNNKYDVIVLADFSNIDAYLKWKKISEITTPVFLVHKGDLPFDADKEDDSYLFTANINSEVNNFFIPNSRFPHFIDNYFTYLEMK